MNEPGSRRNLHHPRGGIPGSCSRNAALPATSAIFGSERQPSLQMVADTVQVIVSEDGGRRAGFHVSHPAAVDLAVRDRPAPWAVRPGIVLLVDREHVHVAVEHQMVTGSRPREGAHDVWHAGLGRDHAEGKGRR